MAEQDKDIKTKIHNNAKTAKRDNVKKEKRKETFEDHLKGTAVDPDFDPNLNLKEKNESLAIEESEQEDVLTIKNTESNTYDGKDSTKELVHTNDCPEENKTSELTLDQDINDSNYIDKTSKISFIKNGSSQTNKVKYFFLISIFFLIGFLGGQYYETNSRNTVYVLDEVKFLKLASVGIATSDQDKATSDLSDGDRMKVKDAMIQVNKILSEQYTRYPVLIQKRNKTGYDLYNLVRRIDITIPVIIQLIGKDKWDEIGKILK